MPKAKEQKFNFKQSYANLQGIMTWFEQEDIDLEEGVKKYEEGSKLVKDLKQYLETVENKITELGN